MIAPRRPPSSRPFLAAPRTDFYHPARAIDAALQGLERAIRRSEGIGLVVGPPGTGKSLLLAKVAEHVRDDFDVALLSGARICTRRALWQSILSEIGEPYRGIDEGELRIGVVERVRGLASTGSGLVVLVDEAHTLPTRLLEELRLLANTPAPLPAVHIILAGTTEMEERLGLARMESLAQRIGVRFYLEPLDHAETVAYLRTQMKVAGQQWDAVFDRGSDDAVFAATDGVPRLVNQLCDLALVQAADTGRARIGAADIAAAWRDIQRLPEPGMGCASSAFAPTEQVDASASFDAVDSDADRIGGEVVEFGSLDDDDDPAADLGTATLDDPWDAGGRTDPYHAGAEPDRSPDRRTVRRDHAPRAGRRGDERSPTLGAGMSADNPWSGPDVEIVFDGAEDPFADYFAPDDRGGVERCVVRGPDDFAARRHVASREGAALVRKLPGGPRLPAATGPAPTTPGAERPSHPAPAAREPLAAAEPPREACAAAPVDDDSDMLVIEEDLWQPPQAEGAGRAKPVRIDDYRRLFARMRGGDRRE